MTNEACIESELTIEDKEWKESDSEVYINGRRALNVQKSYMICNNGEECGILYLVSSGQEVKEQWDILGKYIDKEVFLRMNSKFDVVSFNNAYGGDGNKDDEAVFRKLRKLMFEFGITDKVSICIFLATISSESGYGKYKLEAEYYGKDTEERREYFKNRSYTKDTCGVGLVQVTAENQKKFMEWLKESGWEKDPVRLEELDNYIKGYDIEKYYIENNGKVEEKERHVNKYHGKDNKTGAADFLAEHYALEISVWYWAKETWYELEDIYDENSTVAISPNDFIVKYAEMKNSKVDNIFLAAQNHINAKGNYAVSRRMKMAMQEDKNYYKIYYKTIENNKEIKVLLTEEEVRKKEHEDDQKTYEVTFFNDNTQKDYTGALPLGWGQRYHDWVKLKEEWEK